jgi:transcriptional regulator with XRE-family HTH domain
MTSFVVTRALKRLGSDLKNARRRRRIKAALMAERVGVTRATLDRMEKGSPTVGMGIYATAIYSLDPEKLEALATIFTDDTLGQAILDRDLPKRIRGRSAL